MHRTIAQAAIARLLIVALAPCSSRSRGGGDHDDDEGELCGHEIDMTREGCLMCASEQCDVPSTGDGCFDCFLLDEDDPRSNCECAEDVGPDCEAEMVEVFRCAADDCGCVPP